MPSASRSRAGRKRTPHAVPGALTRAPKAPDWMTVDARVQWKRVVPEMVAAGLIMPEDLSMVEELVVARGRVREIERMIQDGIAAGHDFSKLQRLQNTTAQLATRLAAELMVTPAMRARIAAPPSDADDEFGAMLA